MYRNLQREILELFAETAPTIPDVVRNKHTGEDTIHRLWVTMSSKTHAIKSAAWNAAHPQKVREAEVRYRLKHKDAKRARDKAWKAANPERVQAMRLREYAKRRAKC
jgi:hypothetical protein